MAKKDTPKVEETAVAVAEQETAVATAHSGAGRGFEAVDPKDVGLPRVKLLQSNSPEVSDRDLNVRAGDFYHTILMSAVEDTVFIPISIVEDRAFMVPRSDEGKKSVRERLGFTDDDMENLFICRAVNNKTGDRFGNCLNCGLSEFDNVNNLKPLCNKNIKVLAWFPSLGIPAILIFSSTSHKHGKKFKDMAWMVAQSTGEDLFSRKYKLVAQQASKNGNNWFEATVKPAGIPTPEEAASAEQMFNTFSKVDLSEFAEDAVEPEATPADREY